ncbi:MAG TPA: molybdate ABC transporter substrate-binding protein [Acidobacteriota bacterium]|nr:molybdate ABC transporter substrate-binding protein [Acidobacteriota bacterium]HMZ81670.1 molybdate ABC transporter substrate-binding protein [Acidobacteriota bacterium]HNB70141.1 molybdate ABC transporter substrate-binding protein [Acidobacteriota bacterium]HNC43835.1 molybdate ABC transporter substrate-binding protein [Acidobacteriota bacterium]HNG92654.1 molybdate ABC transporter substrate-binding protein [Acidobacteriota bacterium]
MKNLLCLLILVLAWAEPGCTLPPDNRAPEPLRVAAAADLNPALQEMTTFFQQRTGQPVEINFGSTGLLTRQIEQGAPVDLFFAADQSYTDQLRKQGLVLEKSTTPYAQGYLAGWQRADAPRRVTSLAELTNSAIRRIAIANPDHAPYGKAAIQALQAAKIYDQVQSKLILAENISQAFQYVSTGNADVGLVAKSLVPSRTEGHVFPIDSGLYQPLNQTLCILKRTQHPDQSRRLAEFVLSPEGQQILQKYGFGAVKNEELRIENEE